MEDLLARNNIHSATKAVVRIGRVAASSRCPVAPSGLVNNPGYPSSAARPDRLAVHHLLARLSATEL